MRTAIQPPGEKVTSGAAEPRLGKNFSRRARGDVEQLECEKGPADGLKSASVGGNERIPRTGARDDLRQSREEPVGHHGHREAEQYQQPHAG